MTTVQCQIIFAKIDLKDGHWRMVVPGDNKANFAYVLPKLDSDTSTDFDIAIPSASQMGLKLSPSLYFCVASETAKDVTCLL